MPDPNARMIAIATTNGMTRLALIIGFAERERGNVRPRTRTARRTDAQLGCALRQRKSASGQVQCLIAPGCTRSILDRAYGPRRFPFHLVESGCPCFDA